MEDPESDSPAASDFSDDSFEGPGLGRRDACQGNPRPAVFQDSDILLPRRSSRLAPKNSVPAAPPGFAAKEAVGQQTLALAEYLSCLCFLNSELPSFGDLIQEAPWGSSRSSNGHCRLSCFHQQDSPANNLGLLPGNCFDGNHITVGSSSQAYPLPLGRHDTYLENQGCRDSGLPPASTSFPNHGASLSPDRYGGFCHDGIEGIPFPCSSSPKKLPNYKGDAWLMEQHPFLGTSLTSTAGWNGESESEEQNICLGTPFRGFTRSNGKAYSVRHKPVPGNCNGEEEFMRSNSFTRIPWRTPPTYHNWDVVDLAVRSPLDLQLETLLLKERVDPAIAMEQEGSKCLQRLLNLGNPVITGHILSGVLGAVYEIMKHQNGYRVFTKLMDVLDCQEKEAVVWSVIQDENKFVQVIKDHNGNISAKKLITSLKRLPHLCDLFTSALSSSRTFELMIDRNGAHFIDHCFIHLTHEKCSFIYVAALEHFHKLARDQKGCFSLKTCLINSKAPYRRRILNQVIENSCGLATDPHGNYIVKAAIALQDPVVTAEICSKIKEDLIVLSVQKFSSFVVQECLRSSSREELLRVLVECKSGELEKLAQDPYGNYVLQTALEVPKSEQLHHALDCAVKQFPEVIWSNLGGRHVLNSLRRVSMTKARIS